jgi:hypothetical protein
MNQYSLGEFFSKYKIRDSEAVLVRPDDIIAWKAVNNSEVEMLSIVLKQTLWLKMESGSQHEILRSQSTPEINGMTSKMKLEDKDTPRRKSPGGILGRMTTIRSKNKLAS